MEAKGLRYNTGKRQWSLVDFKSLEPMVQVLEFGAHKYSIYEDENGKQIAGKDIPIEEASKYKIIYSGANNWKGGLKHVQIAESLIRHLTEWLAGTDNDEDSKLPHAGHILCNAMFLSHMILNKPELDNREK